MLRLRVARMKELEGKHQSRKEMKAAWDSQVQRKQEVCLPLSVDGWRLKGFADGQVLC